MTDYHFPWLRKGPGKNLQYIVKNKLIKKLKILEKEKDAYEKEHIGIDALAIFDSEKYNDVMTQDRRNHIFYKTLELGGRIHELKYVLRFLEKK